MAGNLRSHNSGDDFPVGITTVTHTATDIHGNSAVCSFTITVEENELPVISNCPADFTATGPIVSWTEPTATDNCAVTDFSGSHTPGSYFAVGTEQVTYTANDAAGNSVQLSLIHI